MGLFSRAKPLAERERRQAKRIDVDCPARLVMPSGNRDGRLAGISEDGAHILTGNPPAKGSGAILEWPGHESYCHVIWVDKEGCGMAFDRPLPRTAVQETVLAYGGVEGSGRGPAAERRISFGQKRAPRLGG